MRDGELAATSDKLYEILGQLRDVEARKRRHQPGSAEFIELAHEAERLSRIVFRWTEFQADIAEDSPAARARGEMSGRPIDELEPRRLDRILADWREAELRLSQAKPDAPEARDASRRIERLREEYRMLQDRLRTEEGGPPG